MSDMEKFQIENSDETLIKPEEKPNKKTQLSINEINSKYNILLEELNEEKQIGCTYLLNDAGNIIHLAFTA